jgi:hypothetical protein
MDNPSPAREFIVTLVADQMQMYTIWTFLSEKSFKPTLPVDVIHIIETDFSSSH